MSKKILLVDFDGNNFHTLNTNLEEKDFIVIQVNDGLNALEKFQKENPDLVILQSDLPQVHAFYFCKKVRQEYKKETPIIIISENYSKQIEQEGINKFKISGFFPSVNSEEEIISKVLSISGNGKSPIQEVEENINSINLDYELDDPDELPDTDVIDIVINGKEEKVRSQDLFGDIIEKLSSS
ncbi:response regulator [Candidatus Aminicenantes bacterium AC-335-K20]|jgi:two-component system response regulator VicR|nr:response regulator [SCandidatus Aminicenantes bacterium Aminicenantia_JdfR_composite]MCP2618911.1 response regulator [Candidatus Aminicenantes bacterium AC-335-A11]MCP2619576.1 response regulator [Candidatus Aminicenantes bacterium AC-335-K20]MCP2621107.1 response regulator [Candidatus Aminicenantes bacterium AC-334-E05]